MIVLKKISVKNFLSYGNAPTIFDLDTIKSTLVRGKNGSGKSTIFLDAVIYALYGKPYRNINKPQLINSINKSDMLVELDFTIGSIEYKIVRGMKPAVFDIFANGILVEQDAATRDYQGYLESNILKINEKTFKQIAVLGSASYIPFMQLSAAQRRELIESILDIEVFSKMNTVLKDRIAATKEEFKAIEHKVDLKRTEAGAQQKLIKVMQENTKSRVAEYETERAQLLLQLSEHETKRDTYCSSIDQLQEPEFDSTKYESVSLRISTITKEIASLTKKLKDIKKLDTCPTCLQGVDHTHINHVGAKMESAIHNFNSDLVLLETELNALQTSRDTLYAYLDEHKKLSTLQLEETKECDSIKKRIANIDDTIKGILSNTDNLDVETEKLRSIGASAVQLLERKNVLSEEKHLQDVASQLLKDTGIKTAVVKEYLPVLNQLINKYLSMFEFFVDFTLDESFNEVIKSRGRDVFSYSNFSEGEKRRIDFAILMAFRQMAALKNSAKTNLLVLDEIVDGSFDLDARSMFNDLIDSIPNSNVIVISHADANSEAYQRVIQIEKRGDFSVYNFME